MATYSDNPNYIAKKSLFLKIVEKIENIFSSNEKKCSWLVMNFGKPMFVTHSLSTEKMEEMIAEFANATGLKYDWYFVGGRALILYLGSSKKLAKSQMTIKALHEKFQRERYVEENKKYRVTGLDGKPALMFDEREVTRRLEGIWEYNAMYRSK